MSVHARRLVVCGLFALVATAGGACSTSGTASGPTTTVATTQAALARLSLTPADVGQEWESTSTGTSDASNFWSCVGSGPNPSIGRTRGEVVLARHSDDAYFYESVEAVSSGADRVDLDDRVPWCGGSRPVALGFAGRG